MIVLKSYKTFSFLNLKISTIILCFHYLFVNFLIIKGLNNGLNGGEGLYLKYFIWKQLSVHCINCIGVKNVNKFYAIKEKMKLCHFFLLTYNHLFSELHSA